MNRSLLVRRSLLLAVLFSLSIVGRSAAAELPTASPSDVGMSAAKLDEIEPAMQKYVDDGKLAGIVATVARNGKVVYQTAVGYSDLASETPMRADAIFRIYSMTKPITSVAMMILRDEGKFELDDPVSKYLPEFKDLKVAGDLKDPNVDPEPLEREPTVRDLLRHTAGLTYGFFGNTTVDQAYRKANALDRNSDRAIASNHAGIPVRIA